MQKFVLKYLFLSFLLLTLHLHVCFGLEVSCHDVLLIGAMIFFVLVGAWPVLIDDFVEHMYRLGFFMAKQGILSSYSDFAQNLFLIEPDGIDRHI